MAKKHEGIVVEIGGDTSKLGQALEDVNKKTGSLSTELKGVETMLKLNPGNLDLIAQKQSVLNETIEETKRKLGILKDAQEQVQAQFNKGEITAQQYRDFQREIISTEQKLNKLNSELKETDNTEKKIDFKTVRAGLNDLADKAGQVAARMGQAFAGMAAGLAAGVVGAVKGLASLMGKTGELASNLQEVQNVVDVTFGSDADTINKWAVGAANSFGLSELSAKKYTGTMGAMLKSMQIGEEDVLGMSTSLVGLSGDMASFYNLDHEEAFAKIRAGISGETEPLKQLGINMSVANLEAYALSQGITTSYNSMTEAEKVTLRYNYLMQATADAQGDFARTSEGYANQQRLLQLNMENLSAAIGKAFLPAMTEATKTLNVGMGEINAILADGLQAGDLEKIGASVQKMLESLATQLTAGLSALMQILIPTIQTLATSLISTLATVIPQVLPGLITAVVQVISNLAQAVLAILPTILPMLFDGVVQLIMGIVTAIQENVDPLIQMVLVIINGIATFFVENLPIILSVAAELLFALINGIVEALPTLIPQLIQVLLSIVTFILQNLPLIITVAVQVIVALIQGLVAAIPMIIDMLPQIITAIVSTLVQLAPQLVIAAFQIIAALIGGLIEWIPQIWAAMPQVWKAVYDGVMEGVAAIKEAGKNLLAGLWHGIQEKISWLMDGVRGFIDSVKGVFENFNLFEIGKNIIQGLIDGIKNMIGSITQVASDLVNGIKNKFLSLLGIKSPSRWMRDFVGKMIPQGIAVGVKADTSKAVLAMQDLTSQVMDASTPDMIMMMNQTPLVSTSNRIEWLKDSLGDSGSLANKMEAMVNLMAQYLPNLGKEYQLVVDSGAMVGALQPQIDRQMGSQSLLRERGV